MSLPGDQDRPPALAPDREVVLQNEHVTLWYYPELKIVHHQMMHSPPAETFRELLSEGAGLVERFRVSKWLSDDRGNTLLRPDEEKWANQVWLPRVLRGGFRYWAIVLPEAAIGKLNMRRLAAQHEQYGIVSHIASQPGKAFDWLKLQPG